MSSTHDDASGESAADNPSEREASVPSAPSDTSSLLGQVVAARYTIEATLGEGSIGRSFRATRLSDGQAVALKLVHARLTAEPNFQRRLTRDVEAASKLQHRHIAASFEQGTDEAHGAFICRELLEGEDLIRAAKRAPLTPRRVCELLMQVLSALSEAHRQGVLHRNLKPQNVFVLRDAEGHETVKVSDFGNPQRARLGAEYMAPEQADGGAIDGQADVYAVGVLLYELLTDEVPFRGATPSDTLRLHQTEPLRGPRERHPERTLPRELEVVCIKALAKAPGDRHRSPREMSSALRAVISLLGQRADEPLGSSSFADGSADNSAEAESNRQTMPGEQLRSHTKFWLGAGLLAAVCVAVFLNPEVAQNPDPTRNGSSASSSARNHGTLALERGIAKLRGGEAAIAIPELRNARRALGDAPEVLRALGEALMLDGQHAEGAALLTRYLEVDPQASDREYVRSLIRREEQAR